MKNRYAILFGAWIIIGHSCIKQNRPAAKCQDCQRYQDTISCLRDPAYQVGLINSCESAKQEARKILSTKR